MNTLLLFFALPIATIILSIVLEKLLRNPFFTAAIFFAIYLVLTFTFNDTTYLIYTIAYTILSFITAIIAEYFFQRCDPIKRRCCMNTILNSQTDTLSAQDVNRIANQITNIQNNNNNNCSCNNSNFTSNDTNIANVANNTTGRTTCRCGRR